EQAAAIVAASRYAPLGRRGLAPLVRHRFGDPNERRPAHERLDEELLVILQIEGREGIAQAGEIAALAGVDMVFVGPYDLSQSLGIPGQIADARVLDAGAEIAAAVAPHARLGVFVGDPVAAPAWAQLGVTLFAASTDGQVLLGGYATLRERWRTAVGEGAA
ncbi:MAG: aldolase/citrate lyase family protein, partial [Conexibacter sp.]